MGRAGLLAASIMRELKPLGGFSLTFLSLPLTLGWFCPGTGGLSWLGPLALPHLAMAVSRS